MAALLGLVLLGLAAVPCTGRSYLRGDVPSLPTSRWAGRRNVNKRGLQQQSGGSTDTVSTLPTTQCISLSVPAAAGNLTGIYSHAGRFSGGRPIYSDVDSGNNVFAPISDPGSTTWFMTQGDESLNFFLSLKSNVYEPGDLEGLQQWTRHNDPSCRSGAPCNVSFVFSCMAPTEDVLHPQAEGNLDVNATTVPGGAKQVVSTSASALATTTATTTMSASSATSDTSVVPAFEGCENLRINNGGPRAGEYFLSEVFTSNGRPSYAAAGGANRTDGVFSMRLDVCADGWGIVNSTWAQTVGELPPNATAHEVFLMYVAENLDLSSSSSNCGCQVNAWSITGEGGRSATTLKDVGGNTFIAVSNAEDLEDPSEATEWARFTPATATERSTLVRNFWIDVSCADGDAEEVAMPAPAPARAPTPLGKESGTRQ